MRRSCHSLLPYSHRPSCPSCLLLIRLLLSQEDETYFARPAASSAAASAVAAASAAEKKKEKSSVNSQPDASGCPPTGAESQRTRPWWRLGRFSSFAFRERDEVRGGAYNKAAAALRMHSVVITSGAEARNSTGGKSIDEEIDEFLDKGTVQMLEDYKDRARATVSPRTPVRLPPDSPAESPREDPDGRVRPPPSLWRRVPPPKPRRGDRRTPGLHEHRRPLLFGSEKRPPSVRRGSRGGSNRAATAASAGATLVLRGRA